MADLRHCSRKFLTEFIELYKTFPCLWKVKTKDYSNKDKKNEAYEILVQKLREAEPAATKETVRNKINTLRAGFRREYRKLRNSKLPDSEEGEGYVPQLWYYDALRFTLDQDELQPSVSCIKEEDFDQDNAEYFTVKAEEEEVTQEYKQSPSHSTQDCQQSPSHSTQECLQSPLHSIQESIKDELEYDYSQNLELSTDLPSPSSSSKTSVISEPISQHRTKRKRTKTDGSDDDILDLLKERLLACSDDAYTHFGRHVAFKLKTLPTKTRIYTEKLINDVLFEAELGNINKYTKIVSSESIVCSCSHATCQYHSVQQP